jgi:hypothetical protein
LILISSPSLPQVSDDIKYGMIEAISHLIHRDYEAIVKDFGGERLLGPLPLRRTAPVAAPAPWLRALGGDAWLRRAAHIVPARECCAPDAGPAAKQRPRARPASVTLDFIPEGTDLRPILPVLAKVRARPAAASAASSAMSGLSG